MPNKKRTITVFRRRSGWVAECPDCGDTYQEGTEGAVQAKLGNHGDDKHGWTDVTWRQGVG